MSQDGDYSIEWAARNEFMEHESGINVVDQGDGVGCDDMELHPLARHDFGHLTAFNLDPAFAHGAVPAPSPACTIAVRTTSSQMNL